MNKKTFRVRAMGSEVLAEQLIEANTAEEAKEKYTQLWLEGQLFAFDYRLTFTTVNAIESEVKSDVES